MKVDLHTHTSYSRDSTLAPAELVERARGVGLDRIAVTDHNRIDGAYAAHAIDPSLVILGEEIACRGGLHLIGLFIHERIPPGLEVEEAAERIRAQNGIVYAPHPFALLWRPTPRGERLLAVSDAVEVFNGRAFLPIWNRRAVRVARARQLLIGAGTDGHFAYEIGGSWTEMPSFATAAEFLRALEHARPYHVRQPSPFVHVASLGVQLAKRVRATLSVPHHSEPPRIERVR
ncbi:MAG: PHP domain-containing protein [Longimicrobiales bacterium]